MLIGVLPVCCRESADPDEMRPPTATSVPLTERHRANSGGDIFTDVAAESGLDFTHFMGSTGEYYFPEIAGFGCALLDYDNDGDLDIYVVQGAFIGEGERREDSIYPYDGPWPPRNTLFRNDLRIDGMGNHVLSFTDVTDVAGVGDTGFGVGCAVGDYDNDGHSDLYVTNFGPNVLYHNRGDGTFEDVTGRAGVDDERWSSSAAFFDYDRDGDLDLYVVNYVNFDPNNNKMCFGEDTAREYCGPKSHNPVPDRLFRNEGDGTFTDVTQESGIGRMVGPGLGVCCADFNSDGHLDVYVANDAEANQLWINQGDGTFRDEAPLGGAAFNEFGLAEAGMGVAVGDYDQDGDEDIFVTHLRDETNTLYVNEGNGVFVDGTDQAGLGAPSLIFTGFGVGWIDYDNDGLLDLFVANGDVKRCEQSADNPFPYRMSDQLFRNRGEGRYVEVTKGSSPTLAAMESSRGAAFGDIDNDGDVDVLTANCNGPVRLLRNNRGQDRDWLMLRLVGRKGSHDALGARVGLVRQGRATQWRRVRTDGSIYCAHDPRVHFGLGDNPAVDEIVVHWPDGSIERFDAPPIRKVSILRQGEGSRLGP